MRHRILTCKNHTDLRWSTKDCAWSNGGYNGSRNIFFNGVTTGVMFGDRSGLKCIFTDNECACSPDELILAPEDALVV